MRFSDFLPPIVGRVLHRTLDRSREFHATSSDVYASYDQAAERCIGFGYESSNLVEAVFRKTVIHRDHLRAVGPVRLAGGEALALLGIALAQRSRTSAINVIDFGGACGAHYFLLKSAGIEEASLNWHVVETSAMVSRARELETEHLRFFTTIEDAVSGFDQVDLAYSSGTLQYVPDAKRALRDLLKPSPRVIVLARLGLTTGPRKVVTIQETRLSHHGPGPTPPGCEEGTVRCPFTFPVQSEMESILTETHPILVAAADPSGVFGVNDEPVIGISYLARRQNGCGAASLNQIRSRH